MITRAELKTYAKERGVTFVEVAAELGISKQKLNTILATGLNAVSVAAIMSAVNKISEKKIEEGKLG